MNPNPPIIRSEARLRPQKGRRSADFNLSVGRRCRAAQILGRSGSFTLPSNEIYELATKQIRKVQGVALVITLLLLSVITFLAVAFLAMSRQNKSAVSASLDIAGARAASDAASARAQVETIATMLSHGDALFYDWKVSENYLSPAYTNAEKLYDPNNVNYDFLANTRTRFTSGNNPSGWAQNIANLYYDPRPPVFVVTNPAYPNNYDFRFWVDINRNGRFETNGDQATILNDVFPLQFGSNAVLTGEPEWIGLLKNPLYHHSATNTFIGRYAYLVLPVGKTLDLNYIYNYLKDSHANVISPLVNAANQQDGYARDQGIGSWELNLAGMLEAISPWAYERANHLGYAGFINDSTTYTYFPPVPSGGVGNSGNAFDDADAILHYRYGNPSYNLANLQRNFPFSYNNLLNSYIDLYAVDALMTAPFDYTGPASTQPSTFAWAGSYETNMFYDPQDLFDISKTSVFFTNRMLLASQRTNTYDRYAFLRLLASAGMGSSPEYGVWVYGDMPPIYNPQPTNPPLMLRTKVNINFDNTSQITNINAPYAPMPTNLVSWNPTSFFANAAELMLRSKIFVFTNLAGLNPQVPNNAFGNSFITTTFGVTNIPIYRTNNPGIYYDQAIHRMLQLAANIYDATQDDAVPSAVNTQPFVRHPTVFRPRFGLVNAGTTNVGINIIGYQQVTNAPLAYKQIVSRNGFQDLSLILSDLINNKPGAADENAWGIPWIVSAEKWLPQFNQYSYNTRALFTRKILFVRHGTPAAPVTNEPPQFTNQFYCMSISNSFGMDAWNAYPSNFAGAFGHTTCYISNLITVQVTNNYNYGFTTVFTNVISEFPQVGQTQAQPFTWTSWNGITGLSAGGRANGFVSFFPTNITSLQACYFTEATRNLVFFTNGIIPSGTNAYGFLPQDLHQTGWPVHNWTLNITNRLVYVLFDGDSKNGNVIDFVNLGPFGSSLNFSTNDETMGDSGLGQSKYEDFWSRVGANDLPGSPMSTGMLNQIANSTTNLQFKNAVNGIPSNTISQYIFGTQYDPAIMDDQLQTWVANDPLVHYTVDDLYWPGHTSPPPTPPATPLYPVTNNLGTVSARYSPWGSSDTIGNNMLFKDPLMNGTTRYASTNWAFPTNKFPGVGWIGRVHRGTPWQTVYLKADATNSLQWQAVWTNSWVKSIETYPTNDWALVDVFTTAPNDNAARGLLSVNQTNDAAWAAVFAGVVTPTNVPGTTNLFGHAITPIGDVQYLMDSPYGINNQRTNYPNGIFHKVGDILGAASLTTDPNGFLNGDAAYFTDDIVERIPQQTLSLLKVGEPQFVIFAWGQSLKPKGLPYQTSGPNYGMYTNYEITGECLTRTVCHLVHTNGLKMVVDSFNVESGNP
jgi:hypothetical protein